MPDTDQLHLTEDNDLSGSARKPWHDVPAGTYVAYVNAITAGATKSGKPRVSIVWRIVNGPERGNRVYDNVTLTEIGDEILKKKFAAICPTYRHIDKLTFEEEADKIVMPFAQGRRYRIDVSYNDRGFVKVYVSGIIDQA